MEGEGVRGKVVGRLSWHALQRTLSSAYLYAPPSSVQLPPLREHAGISRCVSPCSIPLSKSRHLNSQPPFVFWHFVVKHMIPVARFDIHLRQRDLLSVRHWGWMMYRELCEVGWSCGCLSMGIFGSLIF
ncbi:hypothetical protein NPIL_108421 [Nephila pilipes]|uniref:Uncharacterized protein n=1 Tax=Nephila pilipes TaxID=299642 RepID=A0A8X6IVT1_NEPPI|nr:hypothetical protein NPIL_108421 [Nephila pilipes]